MFPFITETYNPIGGICPYNCVYCWAKDLIKRYGHRKYSGKYYLVKGALKKKFKAGSFVFLCDMLDLFADNVPSEIISQVLEIIRDNPESKFLLETKNPKRYFEFLDDFPSNVVLGVTIESTDDLYPETKSKYKTYKDTSVSPTPWTRIMYMLELRKMTELDFFVSVEPILSFNVFWFVAVFKLLRPWAVAVGYDNYKHFLPEPKLEETEELIKKLEKTGVRVFRKTIRKAWWEK